ncbi:hypothetical protein [Olleya sp. R77988]|uniref:hypothetical protein n=1 Tax=Olleya sp. R77988 TaxID=3093875 RepID=UPI0037C6875E
MIGKQVKKAVSKQLKLIKLVFNYAKYFTLKQPKQKLIVVCFDGLFPHGGLVDRLKGIVSFYQVAQELGYDFKVLFDNPFDLTMVLEPNQVDWQINRDQLKWHPTKSKFLYLVNNFNTNPLQIIKQSKAQTFYVYANIDYAKTMFPNLSTLQLESKWRTSFNTLFKKSNLLETKLNQIELAPYIAFHSRFTSLMGDFVDTTTKVLSEEEKTMLLKQLLNCIEKVKAENNLPAYVFSDSVNFIDYIKQHSIIKTVKGNPFHMDNFEGNSNIEGHLKTLIDFFMISKSQKVYFLNIKPMYNSSFSKYAAIIGNTKFIRLES